MNNNIDQDLYAGSMKAALRVDFIVNGEELRLYAAFLYNASVWAKRVGWKNKALHKKNKLLK